MTTEEETIKAPSHRSILEMTHEEARAFLLKAESYCSIDFPPYIVFDKLISDVSTVLDGKELSGMAEGNPRDYDDVNYIVFSNKDGKYAWRPLQLIHPALYVSLVHRLTEEGNWSLVRERFRSFQSNVRIRCLSLPVQSKTDEQDKAEQVSRWWHEVEQRSIELSLDYQYLYETDITDCYGAIYTHSIAWALHTKSEAKKNENKYNSNLIGNGIDKCIQDMRHGQTNGIPQGSVLMDFVAEMVLGYADFNLSDQLQSKGIEDYRILRYRDDYRIFVNSQQVGEQILKHLTDVMIDLGLKLNPAKTKGSGDVVHASIKRDKMAWINRKQSEKSLQKYLLIIHDHALEYPNAGSLSVALNEYYKRLIRRESIKEQHLTLISIVVDIAYRNPRVYPICSAILSKLLTFVENKDEKRILIDKIRRKFESIPNTGHMDIWLQRISLPFATDVYFDDPLCNLVAGGDPVIWNSEWITAKALQSAVDANSIVSVEKFEQIEPVVPSEEVELFFSSYWES